MNDKSNFLLGYGQRLVSDIAAPVGGAPKAHPYTLTEAKKRLTPKIQSAATQILKMPAIACPKNQTVALLTLHPTYLAKSYYPNDLLNSYGLEAVGSQAREISPEKWRRVNPPESALTSEIFVAGPRPNFERLAHDIERIKEGTSVAKDLVKIEDFRVLSSNDKVKPIHSGRDQVLFEIVLHAQPYIEDSFI